MGAGKPELRYPKYVNGNVHTNTKENFWSLLKRGLHGTYVSVEPFHLFRYLDEQVFRYNNRKDMNDSDRFDLAVRQILGRRLTWAEVTGKTAGGASPYRKPLRGKRAANGQQYVTLKSARDVG